jgi:2-dehydro-3-deoxyphosphooctonate aldolase (KDO 8-P synthase)
MATLQTILSPTGLHRVEFGESGRLAVIAGPCLVESESLVRTVAEELLTLQASLPVDFVFKGSYRKANRTSGQSFTGIGDDAALALLGTIRNEYDLPTLTDVHDATEAARAAEFCDVLQIPAFLARQTDLLVAAANTGRTINIKKGQFMAPEDMQFAKAKVEQSGNDRVLLTERGTFFGYGDLVVDFRSLVTMREFGAPVIYDATHSIQRPSQQGLSGGDRRFLAPLARAAMAVGIDGLFIETHPDPANAMSDKASQLPLADLERTLEMLLRIRDALNPKETL